MLSAAVIQIMLIFFSTLCLLGMVLLFDSLEDLISIAEIERLTSIGALFGVATGYWGNFKNASGYNAFTTRTAAVIILLPLLGCFGTVSLGPYSHDFFLAALYVSLVAFIYQLLAMHARTRLYRG